MDNIDDIKQHYQLSAEEKQRCAKTIFDKATYNKQPSERPFAIIVIGQPGAGKSGLMAYSENQFESVVSLDIDDFRAYHPAYDEIKKKHPEAFEQVTGGFATEMVHLLTPELINRKHDLLLHKTRGDDAVIYDTIIPLQQNGYDVILRVLAVNHLESKISALDRSLNEREKFNCCRWVKIDYHNAQYQGIPLLVDEIEQKKLADAIQVFTRGPKPISPVLQYSQIVTDKILSNPHLNDEDQQPKIERFNTKLYNSSKDAVDKAREIDVPKILDGFDKRMSEIKERATKGDEKIYIDEIEQIANYYKNKFGQFGD